jgi:hypothetical protein
MPHFRKSILTLLAAAQSLLAQQEPLQDIFNHSSRELAFRVPTEFHFATQNRRYLRPAAHELPQFQRIWLHGSDGILADIIVVPDADWQHKTSKQIFADGLSSMLSDPTLKVVSRRSYELDGCPAESINYFFQRADGTSQRVDCFLARPNMFVLGYVSSKTASWGDPNSKAFFQSISLKPKK